MFRPAQPALFAPAPRPRSLTERLQALSLVANAACADTAAQVAQTAALAWWNACVISQCGDPARFPPPAAPAGRVTLPDRAIAESRALGQQLARLPIPQANACLGQLYAGALPAEHRTRQGIFYTPPALVTHLLTRAAAAGTDWQADRVLDPACGAGAFLVQAADRMLTPLANADPAIGLANLGTRLRGWDLDPLAAWLAQLSVEIVSLPQTIASGRRLGPVVDVVDALEAFTASAGSWDLVMGNPPFGKVRDTPALRARFRRSLHGHPNLYGMFIDLAVHAAKPDNGVVAYLTPVSFLAGRYFCNLRRVLHEAAPPVSLDLVESRADVFQDVLQEVALSVFRRGRRADFAACTAVHVTGAGMHIAPAGRFVLPELADDPWLLPRCQADAELVGRLRAMPDRLRDWGYQVSTGPLVWNRHKSRLHDAPGHARVPVVWAEAVTPDGRFVLKATKKNHRAWYEPRDAADPNVVRTRCVLVQRTTAKEQHRRLIAAEMPAAILKSTAGVAVENHLNMVRPTGRRAKVPLSVVAAFLGTEAADRVMRCISGSVAISATELAAMPLPSAEAILEAARGPDFDAAVRRLYGLTTG